MNNTGYDDRREFGCVQCRDGELTSYCFHCGRHFGLSKAPPGDLTPMKSHEKPGSWQDQDGKPCDPPGTPAEGEIWWVKLPGAIALGAVAVGKITKRVVTLRLIDDRSPATYERGSVAFIELVSAKE